MIFVLHGYREVVYIIFLDEILRSNILPSLLSAAPDEQLQALVLACLRHLWHWCACFAHAFSELQASIIRGCLSKPCRDPFTSLWFWWCPRIVVTWWRFRFRPLSLSSALVNSLHRLLLNRETQVWVIVPCSPFKTQPSCGYKPIRTSFTGSLSV